MGEIFFLRSRFTITAFIVQAYKPSLVPEDINIMTHCDPSRLLMQLSSFLVRQSYHPLKCFHNKRMLNISIQSV